MSQYGDGMQSWWTIENVNLSLCFCSDFSYYVVMYLQFREDWHTHLNVCSNRILGGKGTSNFTSLFTEALSFCDTIYWWICQPWCHYFWGEPFYTINSPTMESRGSLKSLKKSKLIPTYIETSINNLCFMLHLFVFAKNHRVTKNLCCLIMKIFSPCKQV